MAIERTRQVIEVIYPPDIRRPEDWGHFIQHPTFTDTWRACGYTDDDLRAVETITRLDTKDNSGIPGTGGIKKTCYVKSPTVVICVWYMCFEEAPTIYLIAVDDGCLECGFTEDDLIALRRVASEVEFEMRQPRRV